MMTDEEGAPVVPDVRDRNRKRIQNVGEADVESIKEDVDAVRMEAPFVPMIAKRREERLKGVRTNTDD